MVAVLFKTTLFGSALLFIKQLNCSRFGDNGQYKRHFCGDFLALCGYVLFIITFLPRGGVRFDSLPVRVYAVMIYLFRDVLRILKRIVYFRSKMSRNMIFRSLFRNSYVCFKTLYCLEEARSMILYDYSSNKTIKKSTR